MASNNIILSAAVLIFYLLLFSTFSSACDPCKPKPKPKPKLKPIVPPAAPPVNSYCPRDKVRLGICLGLRGKNGINLNIGVKPSEECCALIKDMANLEAAACLCTTIQSLLGINILNVPIALSTFLSACGKSIPPGFQCEY